MALLAIRVLARQAASFCYERYANLGSALVLVVASADETHSGTIDSGAQLQSPACAQH